MFNLDDSTYLKTSKVAYLKTAELLIERIHQYATKHNLKQFNLILHGGEPALWPLKNYQAILEKISIINQGSLKITVGVQSNFYKTPSKHLLTLFKKHYVHISVSLDGPQSINDQYRINHQGEGSYNRVYNNLCNIINSPYAHLLDGLLSVCQTKVPATAYFTWVLSLPLRKVDVLFPMHFHRHNTPWDYYQLSEEQYRKTPIMGLWLAQLFDLWWQYDDPNVEIRLFKNIINLLLGGRDHVDNLVNDSLNMFVVNTNGDYEYPDYFKTGRDGNATSPYTLTKHNIDTLHNDLVFESLLDLQKHLPKDCEQCNSVDICGGGFLPGRSGQDGMKLNHRSVLCYDQKFLIEHIHSSLFVQSTSIRSKA